MEQNPSPNPETTTAEAVAEPIAEKTSRMTTLIVGLVTLALAGAGYYYWSSNYTGDQTGQNATSNSDIVATVNGTSISRSDYETSIAQTNQLAAAQDANPNDPAIAAQIADQAITTLINSTLITQAATAAGVIVPEEAVAAQRATIEAQMGSAEAVIAELDRVGMTEADLDKDITEGLLIETYINEQIDAESIAVTEAEVAAFYEQATAGDTAAPALEEVALQIEEQLAGQARQTATAALVEELRANAEIEILI